MVDESADIGPVSTASYAPSATEELAQIVSEELKTGRNAVLLANHGTVAVGRTLREAMRRAVQVERSAKICIGARVLGDVNTLDVSAITANQRFFESYRARPEEDEFSTAASRVARDVRLYDLVNYGFRAGITFASLVQTLILQKLHYHTPDRDRRSA
jgi:rhamnose utilization protein RhaD (predicted bifunctional aldolase and dehydrogenase)